MLAVMKLPVGVVGAAVAMPLLLPPPVPVNQLAEVGRFLTVFDDELVFEQLFGCGTLQRNRAETQQLLSFFFFSNSFIEVQREKKDQIRERVVSKSAEKVNYLLSLENSVLKN